MTDPSRRAKPVGPPPPQDRGAPPSGDSGGSGAAQADQDPAQPGAGYPRGAGQQPGASYQQTQGQPPKQPYTSVYSWSSSGRSFPWLAVLLLVLGVGLLIELFIPDLSFGSLLILAAGVAFGAAWLLRDIVGATVPALVLTGWGLAGIASDLGILTGDGWTTLFIGIAFLIGWGLGRYQNARRDWALFLGLILGVIGLADVSDALPFDLNLAVVIALAMIGIGFYLIFRGRLPTRQQG